VLELDTPYMLRNDGKLISCKELMIHPYINKLPTSAKNRKAAYDFLIANGELNNYEWFLKYSNNTEVKKLLTELIANKIAEKDLDSILDKLSFETNQEFCRVRTSGKFLSTTTGREIYFRISSIGINWFDNIWQILNDNKALVDYVSICTDAKAKNYDVYYKYRGIELNKLPIEDFLTLPGKPIIEKLEENDNKALPEIYEELDLSKEFK